MRKPLDPFNEERRVRKGRPRCPPRAAHEGVGARIDGYCESVWLGPRSVENVTAVTRTQVHDDVTERGGSRSDLTDVYVDEPLSDKATHEEEWYAGQSATNDRDEPREEQGRPKHQEHGAAERAAHRVRARKAAAPREDHRADREDSARRDHQQEKDVVSEKLAFCEEARVWDGGLESVRALDENRHCRRAHSDSDPEQATDQAPRAVVPAAHPVTCGDRRFSHAGDGTLGLACGVHGLERVADQALRAANRAGHIEASIEAPEIFRRFDGFFERGLGKPER